MPGINPHSSGSTANVVIPASSLRRTSSSCSLPIAEQPVSLAETPLEDGWECLRYLRVSAISSTVVPSSERSQLAELDREPHIPLDNNVHRLFKRRRWPSLTDKEYDLLLPSLTIATKFMEQPQLLEFWKHIYLGALEYDGTKGHYLALTKYESSQHADKAIRSVFDVYLPEQLKFGFYDLDPLGNKIDGLSFGSEERYRLFCACYQLGPPDLIFCHPHIVLHIHYLYDLKYLVEYGTEDEMRDVFLRIAITLCHELAHIVWKYRIQGDFIQTLHGTCFEPRYQLSDLWIELGHAWEHYTFRGSIWTIDHPGYFATYYRPQHCYEDRDAADTRVIIPRWWINIWFRKSTWDRFGDLHKSGELYLPNETESGYAFHKNKPSFDPNWTLYVHGVPRDLHCNMPSSVPFLLWRVMRHRQQAANDEELHIKAGVNLPSPSRLKFIAAVKRFFTRYRERFMWPARHRPRGYKAVSAQERARRRTM